MNRIIYLVKNVPRHINNLSHSLTLLQKNYFSSSFPSVKNTVLTFLCDEDISINTVIPHEFYRIELPKLPNVLVKYFQDNNLNDTVGYRSMCHFFTKNLFELEIFKNADKVWRLDTDSYVMSIRSDPFDFDVDYSYIRIFGHSDRYTNNLNSHILHYMNGNSYNWEDNDRRTFETNCEIFNTKYFSGNQYLNFANYVVANPDFWIYRWGDHIIRYCAHKVLGFTASQIKGMFYNHQALTLCT